MFCPECRCEYRPGFSVCSDCNVALVSELPPESPQFDDEVLTPLHVTSYPELLGHIADHLEKEGVPYVVFAGTGLPLLDYDDDQGDFEAQPWEGRVMVYGPHFARAKEILAHVLVEIQNRPVPRNTLSTKTQIVG